MFIWAPGVCWEGLGQYLKKECQRGGRQVNKEARTLLTLCTVRLLLLTLAAALQRVASACLPTVSNSTFEFQISQDPTHYPPAREP